MEEYSEIVNMPAPTVVTILTELVTGTCLCAVVFAVVLPARLVVVLFEGLLAGLLVTVRVVLANVVGIVRVVFLPLVSQITVGIPN